jgi:hypothetical protein
VRSEEVADAADVDDEPSGVFATGVREDARSSGDPQ